MKYHSALSLPAGQAAFILSSIAKYASAAAISGTSSSSLSSFTLPSSTATTYDGATISVLPSANGIVLNSTKTVSFSGTSSNAVYTLSDGCVMSAVNHDGSVVFVPGSSCPAISATSSKTAISSGTRVSLSSSGSTSRASAFSNSASKSSLISSRSSSGSSGSSKLPSASSSRLSSAISPSQSSSTGIKSSSSSSLVGSGVQSSRSLSSVKSSGTAISSRSSSSATNVQSSKPSSGSTLVSSSRSSSIGTGVLSSSTSVGSSISQSKSSTATRASSGSVVSSSSLSKSGSSVLSSASKLGTGISSSGTASLPKSGTIVSSSSGSSSKSDVSSTKSNPSASQSNLSKSSSGTSAPPLPTVTLGIITSVIVSSGSTIREPILTGSGLSTPITLPPVTTTFASSQATSAVSSVSSQIVGLIPVLSSWKANPTPLKTDTLNKVNDLKDSVENLISDLGTDSSGKGCDSAKRRKRGLGGLISDVVNSLTCITKDLDNIKNNINTDDVNGVDSFVDDLQGETDDLTDDNDNTSTDKKSSTDSKSDSSKTGSSSSSSSSSSCTKSETALHVTILCQPTVFTTGGSTVSTTTCTSSKTDTVSGCSVTASTTTISTSSSSATQTPCASDTCNGACPLAPAALSGVSMGILATTEACSLISTSTTSALPTASFGVFDSIPVAQPTSGSSKRSSFSYEDEEPNNSTQILKRALPDVNPPYTNYVSQISGNTAWVSQDGSASGHWYDYPLAGHASAGINGIYGCTAVIISSEKGVYLSHIWEDPVFIDTDWNPTSDASFQSNAFDALRDGNQYAQSITALIGTDANPGVLNAIYAPKVFVLTPLTTQWDRDVKSVTTRLRYEDRAQKLANDLAGAIPGSGGSGFTLGYTRTSRQASTQEPGVAGRAILEVDPFQTWLTVDSDPTAAGLQVGRWRLWVEDQLITYQDFWLPHTTAPDGSIQQRGVGYENPCANLTGGSTSSSGSKSATNSGSKTATSSGSKSSGSASSSPKSSLASTLITTTRSTASSSSAKKSSSGVSSTKTVSNGTSSIAPSTTSKAANSSSTSAPLPTLSTTQCVTSSLVNCQYIYFDASACPTTTQLLPASCTGTSTSSSAASTSTAASCSVASDCPACPLAGEIAQCVNGVCDCYTSIS